MYFCRISRHRAHINYFILSMINEINIPFKSKLYEGTRQICPTINLFLSTGTDLKHSSFQSCYALACSGAFRGRLFEPFRAVCRRNNKNLQ